MNMNMNMNMNSTNYESNITNSISTSKTEPDNQYVCFKFDSDEYALDIKYIQEVIRIPAITHVPQMPDFVLGIVNIRGKIVPIFDLRKKLMLEDKPFNKLSKLIVTNKNNSLLSFVIDEISDNTKLNANQIDPTPSVKTKIDKNCINGIGILRERMIVILDFEKLNELINSEINKAK
ncbi:MAG: purine-binding chemotaxis protein CheW [Oligoflexia bacterium]|nr:purine-binding chemotaxis protein CheW [Oligoflexia bacterium]